MTDVSTVDPAPAGDLRISEVSAEDLEARLDEYTDLLHVCVLDGASVNFILPYSREEAESFWRKKVLGPLKAGGLVVFAAEMDGRIVGSVQLDSDTPPNQAHRVEARKLLVHPAHRRQGHARALMAVLEKRAQAMGRTLITLDTRTGDKAEPLYLSLGYIVAGRIPNFCRDTIVDRLDPTTIMYKQL